MDDEALETAIHECRQMKDTNFRRVRTHALVQIIMLFRRMSSVLMLVVMSTEWNGGKDGTFEAHVF